MTSKQYDIVRIPFPIKVEDRAAAERQIAIDWSMRINNHPYTFTWVNDKVVYLNIELQ